MRPAASPSKEQEAAVRHELHDFLVDPKWACNA
jgi:hypothetical protein